jgi:hypothetical protein
MFDPTLALAMVGAAVSITSGIASLVINQRALRRLREADALVVEAAAQRDAAVTANDQMREAVEDFLRRVVAGELVAVTTDGAVGALVVEPVGQNALRVSVEPFPPSARH